MVTAAKESCQNFAHPPMMCLRWRIHLLQYKCRWTHFTLTQYPPLGNLQQLLQSLTKTKNDFARFVQVKLLEIESPKSSTNHEKEDLVILVGISMWEGQTKAFHYQLASWVKSWKSLKTLMNMKNLSNCEKWEFVLGWKPSPGKPWISSCDFGEYGKLLTTQNGWVEQKAWRHYALRISQQKANV